MNFIRKIFNTYIDTSIHVALAVLSLIRITELYLGLQFNSDLDLMFFFGSIVFYNYIKYNQYLISKPKVFITDFKHVFACTIVSMLLVIYFGLKINVDTLIFLMPFVFLTLCYTLPFKYLKSFREIPRLKIFIIAIVWSGVTVLVPYHAVYEVFELRVLLLSIQRMLFVIVLTLPFDIRDLNIDNRELQTLPKIFGVAKIKKFGFFLLGLVFLLEFYLASDDVFKWCFIGVFCMVLFGLQRATDKQSKYYSSFWLEAIPIVWFLLLAIFTV